jgi:alkylation response protein AidB-like acyl-CoA dehydrogenase
VPKENIIVSSGYAMPALEKLQEQATVAKCAELLGIIQTAFQMSVSYAKERTQFGRPIGSFQYLYYRKTKAGEIAFGDSSHHLEKVADWLGL